MGQGGSGAAGDARVQGRTDRLRSMWRRHQLPPRSHSRRSHVVPCLRRRKLLHSRLVKKKTRSPGVGLQRRSIKNYGWITASTWICTPFGGGGGGGGGATT